MKKALLISDNFELLTRFRDLEREQQIEQTCNFQFSYAYSPNNKSLTERLGKEDWIRAISVRDEVDFIVEEYSIVLSLHCKQLFPEKLVKSVHCVNIHPGLNPHNRGWFPQVFSILNKAPLGATIHVIDQEIDHGPILIQKQVPVYSSDTSLTAYQRVLDAELELLRENLAKVLRQELPATTMTPEGNLNLKADFDALCRLDLEKLQTIGETIDLLRALTHGNYKNAWFTDPITGKKCYISIQITE